MPGVVAREGAADDKTDPGAAASDPNIGRLLAPFKLPNKLLAPVGAAVSSWVPSFSASASEAAPSLAAAEKLNVGVGLLKLNIDFLLLP